MIDWTYPFIPITKQADYFRNKLISRKKNRENISAKPIISFGVPQGSILGPILFTVFVKDLSTVAQSYLLVHYADDSQYLHSDLLNNLVKRPKRR